MIHIQNPSQIWFVIYSSMLLIGIAKMVFSKINIIGLISLLCLALLTVINLPINLAFIQKHHNIATEIITMMSFVSLIFENRTKKFALFMVSITMYFTSIAFAHLLHNAEIIIPFASILFLWAIHYIYSSSRKIWNEDFHLMVIVLPILQLIILNIENNQYYPWVYCFIAIAILFRSIFQRCQSTVLFTLFLSFFIICIANSFVNFQMSFYSSYAILYSSVSFALLNISKQYQSKMFNVCNAFCMLQICFIILSPNYFITKQIHSFTLASKTLHTLITVIYFLISAMVLKYYFMAVKQNNKPRPSALHTLFIALCVLVTLQAQIVHNFLMFQSTINLHSSFALSIIFNAVGIGILFVIITVLAKLKFKIEMPSCIFLNNIKNPLHFINYQLTWNALVLQFKRNASMLEKTSFFLMPIFLCVYLLISFI